MALTTLIPANVTVVSCFQFGGQSGKKRKMMTVVIDDAADTSGGIVVGANAGDIPVGIFPNFSKIEWCSQLQVFTTATGAPVRLYPAVPSLAGTSIMLGQYATATDTEAARMAVADATIATTESAQITVVGY